MKDLWDLDHSKTTSKIHNQFPSASTVSKSVNDLIIVAIRNVFGVSILKAISF